MRLVLPDSVQPVTPPGGSRPKSSARRTAVMVSPLDERISLPVTGWLRTRYDIHGVDRIQLHGQQPDGSLSDTGADQLYRQVMASSFVHDPVMIVVVSHDRSSDGTASPVAARNRALKVVELVRRWQITAKVVGVRIDREGTILPIHERLAGAHGRSVR